jgi:cytochrome c2
MSAIRTSCLFALAALMATPATYADGLKGDAAAGKALFMSSSCPTCHAVTKDDTSTVGPNLVGVLGRQAGTKKSSWATGPRPMFWDQRPLEPVAPTHPCPYMYFQARTSR